MYSPNLSKHHTSLKGAGVLILWGRIDTAAVDEARLNDWWTNEHLPERLSLPGFLRARRYCGASRQDGCRIYLACYEASTSAAFSSTEYIHALDSPTLQTKAFMPYLAKMSRSSCNVVQSWARHAGLNAMGNWLLSATFQVERKVQLSIDNVPKAVSKSLFDAHLTILNLHILHHDNRSTNIGNASSSYDGVRFDDETTRSDSAKYIALIDCSLPMVHDSDAVLSEMAGACKIMYDLLGGRGGSWESYQLITTMDRTE